MNSPLENSRFGNDGDTKWLPTSQRPLLPADTTPRPGLVARRVAALEARPASEAVSTTTPPTPSPSTLPASVDTLSPPSMPSRPQNTRAFTHRQHRPKRGCAGVEEVAVDAASLYREKTLASQRTKLLSACELP